MMEERNKDALWFESALHAAALVLFVGVFLILVNTATGSLGVQFDEFTDLVIADGLARNPLRGHSWDGSQARLPMYITAAAMWLAGLGGERLQPLDALPMSRALSMGATVVAILATFVLGRRLFDARTGLLAAGLFSFSPFVLTNGRSALTEGDAFTAPAVLLVLLAVVAFEKKRTTLRLFVLAMALAGAIGSKFYLVVLLPAIVSYQLLAAKLELDESTDPDGRRSDPPLDRTRYLGAFTLASIGTGLLALLATLLSVGRLLGLERMPTNPTASRVSWLVSLLGIGACLVLAIRHGRGKLPAKGTVDVRWPLGWAWLAIVPLAAAGSLSLLPTHIFNPNVLPTLLGRFLTLDGSGGLFTATAEAARVYLGVVLLKLGLPLGVATLVAMTWLLHPSRRSRSRVLLGSVLAWYGLLLALLPIYQPFYLMSVYPLLVISLAALLMNGMRRHDRAWIRYASMAYLTVGVIWLLVGLVRVYPSFGFYGHETIGKRWLGSPSRGYRNVVTVTSDGTTEAVEWLRENAAGGTVLSYLVDAHLISHLDEQEPLPFAIVRPHELATVDELHRYDGLDFAVLRAVEDPHDEVPQQPDLFRRAFGAEPVFEVFRGRGAYRMPVIQIFSREQASPTP